MQIEQLKLDYIDCMYGINRRMMVCVWFCAQDSSVHETERSGVK
jgi:hypothetical protein